MIKCHLARSMNYMSLLVISATGVIHHGLITCCTLWLPTVILPWMSFKLIMTSMSMAGTFTQYIPFPLLKEGQEPFSLAKKTFVPELTEAGASSCQVTGWSSFHLTTEQCVCARARVYFSMILITCLNTSSSVITLSETAQSLYWRIYGLGYMAW